jgi:hypothetical protein
LEPSKIWLYDLENTLGELLNRTLISCLSGGITEEEKAHSSFLNSYLFRGGLEALKEKERKFVDDFIEGRSGTQAGDLFAAIEKRIVLNPITDKMGGQVVSAAVRAYMAVVMKHSGMLALLLQDRSAEIEDQLLSLWLEGRKLRSWIGSEHRRLLLEQTKEEESKEDQQKPETAMEEEENEGEGHAASYESLSAAIIEKCRFLLQFAALDEPALSSLSPKQPLKSDDVKSKKLRVSREAQNWKDLFTTWQRTMSQSKTTTKFHEIVTSLPELIRNFLTQPSPTELLRRLVLKRVKRAATRASLFQRIRTLLEELHSKNVKHSILRALQQAFHNFDDPEDKQYFLCNLRACGFSLEKDVTRSFSELLSYLVHLLSNSSSSQVPLSTKRFIINSLAIHYKLDDHELLHQVQLVPLLHSFIVDAKLDDRFTSLAAKAFRYLSIICLSNSKDNDSSVPNPLQKVILDFLFADLEQTFDSLQKLKNDLPPTPMPRSKEEKQSHLTYYRQEQFLYDSLYLLHLIAPSNVCESFVSSPQMIHLLMQIAQSGTPRLQRMALRTLRHALAVTHPKSLAQWDQIKPFLLASTSTSNGIVNYFLESIGHLVDVLSIPDGQPYPPPQNFRPGLIVSAISSEIVMLLRTLINVPIWTPFIVEAITEILLQIPSFLDPSQGFTTIKPDCPRSTIRRSLGALSVIGGHHDVLRIGGRRAQVHKGKSCGDRVRPPLGHGQNHRGE